MSVRLTPGEDVPETKGLVMTGTFAVEPDQQALGFYNLLETYFATKPTYTGAAGKTAQINLRKYMQSFAKEWGLPFS
jgi:hypothetical protein